MTAIGIDLGGTKIEAQVFNAEWAPVASKRVETPDTYDDLLEALVHVASWADLQTDEVAPLGVGAAGLLNPKTRAVLTANLPANDKPLPLDFARLLGRPIAYVNDAQALALSEAIFGAARNHRRVVGLVLGTGIGGGTVELGRLQAGPTGTGGEFGHMSAPAFVVSKHDLPTRQCGCGRWGCFEALISGSGMTLIAEKVIGETLSPSEIADARHNHQGAQKVWDIWCELVAELLHIITVIQDPDCIVLGGGLSNMAGVAQDLALAAQSAQLGGFGIPEILLAQGGDASGARGAAYAAACAARG